MSDLDAVGLVDELYRRAVETPDSVDDSVLEEWMGHAAEAVRGDREQAKVLRKAVRTARKLARYWSEHDADVLPDWRNGIDEALGGRGWQCQLDLVMNALEAAPDPELFEAAKQWQRAVLFIEWMDGVDYEEWLEGR